MTVTEEEPEPLTESTTPKKQYECLEDLPGVGPATSKKLQEMGFHTIESLATATARELAPAGI
ncbi:MAG: DNA repair and recombination protein RadA, partial [Candidatus Bathyarchaeota archaeon]|nr:DNA repair and recombination protein RadA [Candidatus Bathyarchaeota archaeon]